MDHRKKHNGKIFTLISCFVINNCACNQSEVGYRSFDCCNDLCNSCENLPLPEIPNLTFHRVQFFQFQVIERYYKSKRTREVKLTKRTARVQKEASVIDLEEDFTSMRKGYLVHCYQIENNKFQWSRIIDRFRVWDDLPSRLFRKLVISIKV